MSKTCGTSVRPRQLRERYCAFVDANVVQRRLSKGDKNEDFICYNRPSCKYKGECSASEPEPFE